MENDGRSKSVIRDGKWRSRYLVLTDGRKTRAHVWNGVETSPNGREQVETCGNNDSDGYRESRYAVFTDAQKTRVSATKTPRNPNRTGWENGELRDPRNPQNSWEGGFPFGILGEVGSAPPA